MTESSPWPFLQAWLIMAVITYGALSLFAPTWRRRTRIVLSVFAPLAVVLLMAWWILRVVGSAGRED
ncbi:hypothetical protein [Rhodoglobus vestalii]|nr:hypothetical protein [Rhodoglobus vestalii]